MEQSSSPIVVLDSGLGGLTVVRALRQALPNEDILYFGDTARLPYGSKTAETVTRFVEQIIAFLLPCKPRHVVIACNTATALALPAVRATFAGLSLSGVIEPGARAAIVAAGSKSFPTIGVIATEATVKSKAYARAVHRRRSHARLVFQPTPLLVPLIEEGRSARDPVVRLALLQYLEPLMKHGIDVLVLGCTHYPIYRDLIEEILGPKVSVIDSAKQCADDVALKLRNAGQVSAGFPQAQYNVQARGILRCMVTDDPQRFGRLAPRFLGVEIEPPELVSPDELYSQRRGGALKMPA